MVSVEKSKGPVFRDERWTNRDKVGQVHGLLTLKKRDLKQATFDVSNLTHAQSDEIKTLRKDIEKARNLIGAAQQGNAQQIKNTLRSDRAAQLALRDKPISAAMEYLEQSNFVKCKELNSIRCKKIKMMRELLNLKLELNRLETAKSESPDVKQEQTLTNLISRTTVKQDAAQSVFFTYTNILAVLRKDQQYFTPLLETLNRELMDQCKAILKVTGKGQSVTEEAADIKEECRQYEEKLKMMMHDRMEAVNQMRMKVEHNRSLCKALVRTENGPTFGLRQRGSDVESLQEYVKDLQYFERVMQKLRNITQVKMTDEIYPRMKDQIRQRDRLLKIVQRNTRKRDAWLSKRNQAETMKDHIMHNMGEFTVEYKRDKNVLVNDIAERREEQRQIECEMEALGRFMVSLRAALFTIASILDHVRAPEDKTYESAPDHFRWDSQEDWIEELYSRKFEPEKKAPTQNAMKLLEKIYFKLWLIFEQVPNTKQFEAAVTRHQYTLMPEVVLANRFRSGDAPEEQLSTSILDDEPYDPTVPTRGDIKAESKRIVEYNLKLLEKPPDRKVRKPRPNETKYWCPRPVEAN